MIDAARGGVQRFSYNRCDPHVAQPHNRAIRINRNLKDAVIVKGAATVRVDGRKKDLLTCGDAPPAPPESPRTSSGATAGTTRVKTPIGRARIRVSLQDWKRVSRLAGWLAAIKHQFRALNLP
jgi:hypothetical protein